MEGDSPAESWVLEGADAGNLCGFAVTLGGHLSPLLLPPSGPLLQTREQCLQLRLPGKELLAHWSPGPVASTVAMVSEDCQGKLREAVKLWG